MKLLGILVRRLLGGLLTDREARQAAFDARERQLERAQDVRARLVERMEVQRALQELSEKRRADAAEKWRRRECHFEASRWMARLNTGLAGAHPASNKPCEPSS